MSNSLRPHELCSQWNSLGQNTGVGSLSLLQGIFPTQGSNPDLLHFRWILYQLSHKENPWPVNTLLYKFPDENEKWIFLLETEQTFGQPNIMKTNMWLHLTYEFKNLRPDYSFDHLKINTETHRDLNDKTRILPKVNVRIPNCGFYYAEKQFYSTAIHFWNQNGNKWETLNKTKY